jgi:hypothetical protein
MDIFFKIKTRIMKNYRMINYSEINGIILRKKELCRKKKNCRFNTIINNKEIKWITYVIFVTKNLVIE